MKKCMVGLTLMLGLGITTSLLAQYEMPERNDTIAMYPKTPFDSVATKKALEKGTCTIKGVAFTRPASSLGFKAGKKILANKITVFLRPLTPYFEEYLVLQKKENPKKLRFAYVSNECFEMKLTCITNSVGEFVFPELKPGKYYIYGTLPWYQTGVTSEKTGYVSDAYGGADVYTKRNYRNNYEAKLHAIVELKKEGEVYKLKLKDNGIKWNGDVPL